MTNVPEMLTTSETAERSGLAKHYVRQLVLQGKIVHVRAGKKYLVNIDKFYDYLNSGDQPQEQTSGIIRSVKA
jgi:excisionase family DNA binding protein